ncbi:MAG: hypothetical protein A2586_03105 [Candidatus Harrisonbacteria bacterium RIFOXYD1_FULL_40_9]|uniref:UPF0102 protein A2586_03105 n=1 Tax=Candidatus Harrisonbacteria bacterium RIFOXYD1_FULL_40_9 TaxID=1798412 RepID=A0A1G1ZV25_9BACT|nr:MAG: hypothetical protein A2586_03105 [Candidatus Harrisonbacteria bacterium RIFOXYD1_FULL_40_9]
MNTVGVLGEDLATHYLEERSYSILDRNFREKFGEIDIIAKSPDGILVFVEVKTLFYKKNLPDETGNSNRQFDILSPQDEMTQSKIRKLYRVCEFYARKYEKLIDEERGWQIDFIGISVFDMNPKNEDDVIIAHYENIAG